jgi:hypothetical protein
VLEEKIALRDRQSADRGAIGVGSHSGMAACATMDEAVARLLRLQDRIVAELRSPEANGGGGPRARRDYRLPRAQGAGRRRPRSALGGP